MRRQRVDLLIVASGTTMGLRRADQALEQALEALGVSYVTVTSDFRLANRVLHRVLLLIDLLQAAELRLATGRALRRYRPRALIFATTHAALLQPDRMRRRPSAIRFDSPAAISRRGRRFLVEHMLERLNFRRASILLPSGVRVPESARPHLPAGTPVTPLPIPIDDPPEPRSAPPSSTDRVVLTYASSPAKKGLDLAIGAWSAARCPPGWRLEVAGIEPASGRAYLRSMGLPEPDRVTWVGVLAPSEFRRRSLRSQVYLAASRYEDFGLAQLEALVDGSMLVTVPSLGPYEALSLARNLDPRLVADAIDPAALGRSLAIALMCSDEERRRYAERAHALVAPYREQALATQLQRDVLPTLLG